MGVDLKGLIKTRMGRLDQESIDPGTKQQQIIIYEI
jgi:hypothetical protein